MIVSRAPVRFSLGGGGTDLPSYAKEHGGYVIAAAIDKYVFVSANRRFYPSIRLSYSKTEIVDSVGQIEHRIFRSALAMLGVESGIELTSIADLPANSGLGSSSAFTVALLNAIHSFKHEYVSSRQLAEEACAIEIDTLKEPIGKQDQYIAAYGGITAFTFHPDGRVDVEPLSIREEVIAELEMNLVIAYSGIERAASPILQEQQAAIASAPKSPSIPPGMKPSNAVERMHRIKELGYETRDILIKGDLDRYGELLHEHWTNKRKMATSISDEAIDGHYEAAREAGAVGGKLMGAGGGGFFMFYVRPADRRKLLARLAERGLRPLRFRFDLLGARIIVNFQRT
jgi:D-glycero-alpha-D-manno-heptose-7-phosphate kinase